MRFPRQEYWSVLLFPSLGDLPDPVIESAFSKLAGEFFTTVPPGKPRNSVTMNKPDRAWGTFEKDTLECEKKDLETKLKEDGSSLAHRSEIKHTIENTCYSAIALWELQDYESLT